MPSCARVESSCFSTSDGLCALFQSFEVTNSSSRCTIDGMTLFKAAPTCTTFLLVIGSTKGQIQNAPRFGYRIHTRSRCDDTLLLLPTQPGCSPRNKSAPQHRYMYVHISTYRIFNLMWFREPGPESNLRDSCSTVEMECLAK